MVSVLDGFQRHVLAVLIYVVVIIFLAFVLDLLRKLCCKQPPPTSDLENVYRNHNVNTQLSRSPYILPHTTIIETPIHPLQEPCEVSNVYTGVPPAYPDATGLPTYDEALKMTSVIKPSSPVHDINVNRCA